MAATLGSDVPFFLSGGTALGLGRGDEMYPLADLPRHWIVLLMPGFGVSSADAYRWYDDERGGGRRARSRREPQYVPGPWPSRAAQMVNDLEAAIARHHPEIDQMRAALRRAGCAGRRHDRQRIDRVRPVSAPARGGIGGQPAVRGHLAGASDRIARPWGVRPQGEVYLGVRPLPLLASLDYT